MPGHHSHHDHYRMHLNNYSQRTGRYFYYNLEFHGHPHDGYWVAHVIYNNEVYGKGTGSSRSSAKERAAGNALRVIGWV
ncbi:hypothetical protein GYMLUDRAFT_889663 [Collybiopsis luxurians FD-317 M1]|uniref:DRBM domain-containing protein n=1 Tax=Collybiopsis luxurians FD-317 M1 TaxID=944289 RepID=A0A0D0BJL0_9AGAR|nr:hypothetical protein GYMLUDRAFT_889663 [Collybiopsis luxurians FD-317 M1]